MSSLPRARSASLDPQGHRRHPYRALAAVVLVSTLLLSACSPEAAPADEPDGTWTYQSDFGPVEIPESLERIVSVDFYTPAALMDLGVTPVGVVNTYLTDTEGAAIPGQYTEAVAEQGIGSIGEYYELNLEAIVAADPDLIIATDDFLPLEDPMREKLEQVAPILTFTARDGDSWRTRATELAEILDKEDELQPLVDAYEARRDAIKDEYADILDGYAVTVLAPEPDEWGTYADTHFSTPILRDLGATFREQEDDEVNEAGFPSGFSYERLDRLSNADVVFMRQKVDTDVMARLESNGIWTSLHAVQDGMVFEYIPLSPTGSYGWATENLDDLEALLGDVQAAIDANA